MQRNARLPESASLQLLHCYDVESWNQAWIRPMLHEFFTDYLKDSAEKDRRDELLCHRVLRAATQWHGMRKMFWKHWWSQLNLFRQNFSPRWKSSAGMILSRNATPFAVFAHLATVGKSNLSFLWIQWSYRSYQFVLLRQFAQDDSLSDGPKRLVVGDSDRQRVTNSWSLELETCWLLNASNVTVHHIYIDL